MGKSKTKVIYNLRLRLTKEQVQSLKALACRQQSTIPEAIGTALNMYWEKLGRPRNAVFKEPTWLTQKREL